jgi:hypothetical protein
MSPDKCRLELRMQLGSAAARGEINVLINSGELLRAMGWSPGLQHWTPAAKRWKMSKQTEMSCFWKELSEQE